MRFILFDIKRFLSHKLFATIYILSQIIICCSFFFSYGEYKFFLNLDDNYREKEITLQINDIMDYNDLCNYFSSFIINDDDKLEMVYIENSNYICYLKGKNTDYVGNYPDELENNQIIITKWLINNEANIGQDIVLDGINFKITGVTHQLKKHMINRIAFEKMKGDCLITIRFKDRLSARKINIIDRELKSNFENNDIIINLPRANNYEQGDGAISLIYYLINLFFVICVLNTIYLLYYDLFKRKKSFVAMHILGCSRKKMLILFQIELLIFIIFHYHVALLLFYGIGKFILEKNMLLSFFEYFKFLILYITIIFLSITPKLRSFVKVKGGEN